LLQGKTRQRQKHLTGDDKAVATQNKAYFPRKKVCRFCVEEIDDIRLAGKNFTIDRRKVLIDELTKQVGEFRRLCGCVRT